MSMLSEFKEFIAKGNVMDLAVGVIIGAAFQKIVDSAVNDLIMPFVGVVLGGRDFTSMFVVLQDGAKAPAPYASLVEAREAGAAVFAYGAFLTQLIQFLILAWIVFMMVKAVNRMRRNTPVVPS
jgi:large conductance mechanosensitive channel